MPDDVRQLELPAPARAAEELPGAELAEVIRSEVLATLVVFGRGRECAVTSERLAAFVGESLRGRGIDHHLAASTLERRVRIAISELVSNGERIASSSGRPAGYWVAGTLEEFEAGGRTLRQHLVGTARRLRAYDRCTADAVLQLLGQEPLPLPRAGRGPGGGERAAAEGGCASEGRAAPGRGPEVVP